MKPRSRRRSRLLTALALVATAVAALVALALPAVVSDRVADELAASGFPDARFDVRHIGPGGVTLANVALAPDLSIEEVAIGLDLPEARIVSMTLDGARLTADLSALDESSAVRLLTRAGEPEGAAPARIRLARSSVILTTGEGPLRVDVAGEVRPIEGGARLSLRSPLGAHELVVRSRESDGARVLAIEGDGGGDALDATARIGPDGATSIRGRIALAGGARTWAGHRVSADGARLDGAIRIEQGRIHALDLRASAGAVVLDGLALGDAALDATREGERLVWSASARGKGGLDARAGGALGLDPAEWTPAFGAPDFGWEVTGPIPASVAQEAAPFLALDEPVRVDLAGRARFDGEGRWILESIRGGAAIETLHIPDAELVFEGVRVELVARATIDGERVDVEVEQGSELLTRATHLDALHVEGLAASPVLHIVHDDAGVRVEARAPIDTRMARLTVGEGPSALGFEDVVMALSARDGAPIGTSAGDRIALAARMEATSPRIAGLLGGGGVRASADIDVAIRGDDARIAIPLDVRAARISEAESEVTLTSARIALPLEWERGEMSAHGQMRAERIAWRDIPVGATSGAVRIDEDTLRLDWRAGSSAPLRLAARVGLEEGDGSVTIRVPRTRVRSDDPLSRVIAGLTELSIEGPIEGELRLALDAPERGEARIVLDGASVREIDGAGAAHDVRGTLRFTHLDPLESAQPARVTWERLELGGVKLEAGSAALAFALPGDVVVSDMRVGLAGGRVDVAPFRFAWEEPDLALDLSVRGIDLDRVLRAATSGRVTGEGKLDGRVALRVTLGENRRIELGDGRLASRGPGALRVRTGSETEAVSPEVEDIVNGEFIRRRVLAAMEDFEYRRLTMNLSGDGTRRLRARVVGRGKRMPQELDMTLNFRGVQPLLDHAIRLWPDGAEATIEVGQR